MLINMGGGLNLRFYLDAFWIDTSQAGEEVFIKEHFRFSVEMKVNNKYLLLNNSHFYSSDSS